MNSTGRRDEPAVVIVDVFPSFFASYCLVQQLPSLPCLQSSCLVRQVPFLPCRPPAMSIGRTPTFLPGLPPALGSGRPSLLLFLLSPLPAFVAGPRPSSSGLPPVFCSGRPFLFLSPSYVPPLRGRGRAAPVPRSPASRRPSCRPSASSPPPSSSSSAPGTVYLSFSTTSRTWIAHSRMRLSSSARARSPVGHASRLWSGSRGLCLGRPWRPAHFHSK